MGLSVGVVSIDYLDEPQPPVSDFLKELAMNPNVGIDADDYWGGGWADNSFLEFQRPALTRRACNWCADKSIDASGANRSTGVALQPALAERLRDAASQLLRKTSSGQIQL